VRALRQKSADEDYIYIEKQFRAEKHARELMTIDGKGTVFCINPFTAPASENSAG